MIALMADRCAQALSLLLIIALVLPTGTAG